MVSINFTENGSTVELNAEMLVMLYLPFDVAEETKKFLKRNRLDEKFEVIEAEIRIMSREDDDFMKDVEPIRSLLLKMKDEKVLFEYKLSDKEDELIEKIRNYVYKGLDD